MTGDMAKPARDGVVLRYLRVLPHPIDAVWRAITDPAEIQAWWGTRPEIDLRVGGEYVSHHATGDRVVDRILRVEPPSLFEHTFWQHVNPDARVTWELTSVAAGTQLVLTHSMTIADLRREAAAAGHEDDPYRGVSQSAGGWIGLLDRLADRLG
jgi:uncharacterized protein YndB with AHSA1/START domain